MSSTDQKYSQPGYSYEKDCVLESKEEMRARLAEHIEKHDTPDKAFRRAQISNINAMSDQEIRALECAVRMYVGYAHGDPTTMLEQAKEFEAYIRGDT